MIFYDLNGIKFHSPFAAFLYGSIHDPHTFPRFNFFDAEFSLIDWTSEPTLSFQTLCDLRAHQLRNKYDRLILLFSGGTDSITVYNTFVRNNIHIDEIVVVYSGTDAEIFLPTDLARWVITNHKDKTTKITLRTYQTHDDTVEYEKRLLNENFLIEDDDNFRHQDAKFCMPVVHSELINQSYDNYSHCVITGFEKPRLIELNDGYYFEFLDKVFSSVMMRQNIEFFFVSPDMPELHAKQCHMMLNYCLKTNTTFTEIEKIENYYLKCAVQGRDPEPMVLRGHSMLEKTATRQHANKINQINFSKEIPLAFVQQMFHNQISLPFASAVERKSPAFRKYVNGWNAIQSDKTLVSYMVRMGLLSSQTQPVQSYHGIRSKAHKIKCLN